MGFGSFISDVVSAPAKVGGTIGGAVGKPFGQEQFGYNIGAAPLDPSLGIITGEGFLGNQQGGLVGGMLGRPTVGQGGSAWAPSVVPYTAPAYTSILTPEGNLPTDLTMESSYDPQYFNQLQEYATAEGPSPWLTEQQALLESRGATSRDMLEQQRLGGLAEAKESLAMRRGLSTGAGERLEEAGIEAKMMENQKLSRALEEQLLGLQVQEQESKLGVLGQLPGYEAQRAGMEAQIDQSNIANILAEREREFAAEMDAYKTQMGAWAAQQQAGATAQSAMNPPGLLGGGGVLGIGIENPLRRG